MALNRDKFRPVGNSLDVARMWPAKDHPLKEGDSIEGEYLAKQSDVGSHKSNVYVLEVEGERVGVWGSTVIDARMDEVAIGAMVGFEYLGMRKGKNADYKDFMVAVADDGEVKLDEEVGAADEDDPGEPPF
jgi:hypothetical protein